MRRRSFLGLIVALCLLWAGPAQAAIAILAGANGHTFKQSTTGNDTTTASIDTTGASFLVVGITCFATATPGASDSKSNTWLAGAAISSASTRIAIFYVKNPTVGSGHTFSTTCGNSSFPAIFVAAFSGTDTTANKDQENSATSAASTTIQPGSVTPTTDNQLLVTYVAVNAVTTDTFTINSGFTITDQATQLGGTAYGGGFAYLVQGTAAAVNPTWTLSTSDAAAAGIDTFKASVVVPSTEFFFRRR